MNIPKELKYTRDHEWLKVEDGYTTVGITDFAQEQLGGLVFVNLPEVGDEVTAATPMCDVESVKAVSDVFSPLTGTIKEINEELLDSPELINEKPYEAWFVKIEDVTHTDDLLSAEEYEAFIKEDK